MEREVWRQIEIMRYILTKKNRERELGRVREKESERERESERE